MEDSLNTVTIGISSTEDVKARAARAFTGESQGAFVSFPTVELLWKVITPKRWQLLRLLTGVGPMSIRAPTRQIARTWRGPAPRRRSAGGIAPVTSGARSLRLSDIGRARAQNRK